MERREALRLIYFAILIISSVLPESFFVRWFSMIMLSASLIILLIMKFGKTISILPSPRNFYYFVNETHNGSLARTSDLIKRASLGYSFARELVADRIIDIIAQNFTKVSKNELRRSPEKFLLGESLLRLIKGESFEENDYLQVLEMALDEVDIGGD